MDARQRRTIAAVLRQAGRADLAQIVAAPRPMRVTIRGQVAEGQLRDGTWVRALREMGPRNVYRVIRMDDPDRVLYQAKSFADAIAWANNYIEAS